MSAAPKGPPKPPPGDPSPDAAPAVLDPKADLEKHLVEHAMEPWTNVLPAEAQDAARLFVDLLVKTHPEMQRAIDERVTRDARNPAQPKTSAPQASGVVTNQPDTADPVGTEAAAPGRSGVVAKRRSAAPDRRRKRGS